MPNFPMHRSLEERMAGKVISRVVTDGLSLTDAIEEAVKFADLNRQQIISLCAVLQDYGMVYNGDPRSYFQSQDDMGKSFPNPNAGYQVYAKDKSKIKTSSLNKVFDTIVELRKKGFKDEEIIAFNPDLSEILAAIDEAETKLAKVNQDLNERISRVNEQPVQEQVEEPVAEEEFAIAARDSRKIVKAQVEDVEVEAPTKENIANALDEANAEEGAGDELGGDTEGLDNELDMADEDLGGDELGGDEEGLGDELDMADEGLGGGDGVSAKVRPAPSELESKISDAPDWEVENILSIQSAENFYNNLRKELEAVVFNENIVLDKGALSQYDKIRAKIDEQLDKIKEAQKEKKKLEDKENQLEDEFEGENAEGGDAGLGEELTELPEIPGEENVEGEVPTEEIVAEEGQESPFGRRNPK